MICPHCDGELVKSPEHLTWDYDCKKCSRGWMIVGDVYWLACFDAGGNIYKIKDGKIEHIPDYEPLWKELWNRVKDR